MDQQFFLHLPRSLCGPRKSPAALAVRPGLATPASSIGTTATAPPRRPLPFPSFPVAAGPSELVNCTSADRAGLESA